MDTWEAGELSMLLQQAQLCNRQISASASLMTPERLYRAFNGLMREGKVYLAVRLRTELSGGGVLDPKVEAQHKPSPMGNSSL